MRPHVGARIATTRRQRGISRKTLADLIGRSEEWLRQIENGQRRLDSIEYALRLASALRMSDLMAFVGPTPAHASQPPVEDEIVEPIREAITDSVRINAFERQTVWDEAAKTLESDVEETRRRWHGHGRRYHITARLLPRVLRGAAWRLHDDVDPAQLEAAITAFHLGCVVLSRLGDERMAWVLADRALRCAERLDESMLLAAAWHVCERYIEDGCHPHAYRLATHAFRHVNMESSEAATLAVAGALRLSAARAAAGMLESHRCQELIDSASALAERLVTDRELYLVPFGPTEVGIAQVAAAIRLGRLAEALRVASDVVVPDDYSPDRQARHYIPLAYLHARRREDAAAVFALGKVAALSPDDVRYDGLSRQTLAQLLHRNNQTVRQELSRLARLAYMLP